MALKKHYDLEHDGRAYRIDSINDRVVRIGARILASKIVRKNRLVQCNSGVVSYAELCAKGVQMNWSVFLMNQLAEEAVAAQAGERSFTYSWLLILIALVSWMEPNDY